MGLVLGCWMVGVDIGVRIYMYNARGWDRCSDDLHSRSFLASATHAKSDTDSENKDTEADVEYVTLGFTAC